MPDVGVADNHFADWWKTAEAMVSLLPPASSRSNIDDNLPPDMRQLMLTKSESISRNPPQQ